MNRGSRGNQIWLRDALRRRLERELRYRESEKVGTKTTFIKFCEYLGLDPETTTWSMIRTMLGVKWMGDPGGSGPRIKCYLIDVLTRVSMYFRSANELVNYLNCRIDNQGVSSIGDSLSAAIREGCIITHKGRDKYLVSNLDVDTSRLEYCKISTLGIRLAAQSIGIPVDTFSSIRDIKDWLPIVGTTDSMTEDLCKYFGLGYTPRTTSYRDTSPRKVTLYSHNNIYTFRSIGSASRFLKVDPKDISRLYNDGLPCPYRGVEYWIEIEV